MPLAVSNNPKQEIRLNTKLEDVLNRDPVAEAEGLVEILQRAGLVEGDGTSLLLGHALSVNKLKAEALEAVGDTNYGSKLTKYQAVIEKLGFRKVLELPFTGHKYGSEEAPQETFFVYFRDNGGVLLCFDTYNTDSVNGGHFYYNWKPNDIKDKYAYHVTSSGGWRVNYPDDMPAPKWEELYKDGVRLTSGPGIEKEERRNEYFHEHAVWVGDHDCREAIRHNIGKLEEFGKFVTPWVETPWLWLCHYGDNYLEDGSSRDYADKYHERVRAERLAMLPEDVRKAMGL
jgi:hypothetical protein